MLLWLWKVLKSGGIMFGKLEQCIGKNVSIEFWKDGKLCNYEGILDRIVNYKYILIDRKNYLLFLAANGAIASIKCDDEVVYESVYARREYEPIKGNIEDELSKRELDCFDEEYANIRAKSTMEYFLKRGRELMNNSFYREWEKYVKENIDNNYAVIKAVVDIVDIVESGESYYLALVQVLAGAFDYNFKEIELINDMVLHFFANPMYEYTDYAVFMLHYAAPKRIEQNCNMSQLMNTENVFVSLAKRVD